MFGTKLRILVDSVMAIILAILIAAIGLGSWSQSALTTVGWLLTALILPIRDIYHERSITHPNREDIRFRVSWVPLIRPFVLRQEHLDHLVRYMFGGVLIFPVTQILAEINVVILSPEVIEILHIIFTALSIFFVYLGAITFYEKWTKNWWITLITMTGAVIDFLLAYFFGIHSIAWGETAIAFATLIFILRTNKQEKQEK